MSISNELKGLLARKNIEQQDLRAVLGFNTRQGVNNKFAKNNWKASELIKVVEYLGGNVQIVIDDIVIPLHDEEVESR